jgi:F0F1-type ATP synthase assembly protein I
LRYSGLGLELAGAVALFTLLGWWIDGRFGTAPWGVLIGALLGMAGGMFNLVREAMRATHPEPPEGTEPNPRRDEEP